MERKASELDNRCSEACIRAGLTALLFAALAFSMLSPLTKQKSFDALGDYILSRLLLKDALDALEVDKCWQILNSRETGVSKWTIDRLIKYDCSSEPKEPETSPPIAPPPLNSEVPDAPLLPPSFLRISEHVFIDSATIVNQLTILGNGDLLTYARHATNQYDFKIYRWAVLWSRHSAQPAPVS